MKNNLIEEINIKLLNKGFTVKNIDLFFDILAKKKDKTILIKILEDANSISIETAKDMISLASFIYASPLIISNKAGLNLEDNVTYSRFNVPVINLQTFHNCLDNNLPFLKSTRAGLTASFDKNKIKDLREEYSLNTISKKLGVSKSMVLKYEKGSTISHKKIIRIYDSFGNIFSEIDPLTRKVEISENYSSEFGKKYFSLGFKVSEFLKTPFDLASKRYNEIILTKVGDKFDEDLIRLADILGVDDLVIFEKKKPKDIPSIKKDEFLELEKAKELIKVVKEF
nr:hypothetical protein [Candidatus Woesearchaeota archaeon]